MAKEVNEALDTLLKIKELLKPIRDEVTDTRQGAETQKVKVLRIALDELRRVHDHISNSYDQLRLKALAMLAGEVAIVSFLFSGVGDNSIKMPHTIAGKIFLFTGIISLLMAFICLLGTIKSAIWAIPGDMDEIEQINNGLDNRYDTVEKFLLFMRKDYLDGNRECIKIVANKARLTNWGLYLLLAGVIILLVIKFGGH